MFLGNGFSFESLRLAETGARYFAAANAIVGGPDEHGQGPAGLIDRR